MWTLSIPFTVRVPKKAARTEENGGGSTVSYGRFHRMSTNSDSNLTDSDLHRLTNEDVEVDT